MECPKGYEFAGAEQAMPPEIDDGRMWIVIKDDPHVIVTRPPVNARYCIQNAELGGYTFRPVRRTLDAICEGKAWRILRVNGELWVENSTGRRITVHSRDGECFVNADATSSMTVAQSVIWSEMLAAAIEIASDPSRFEVTP